ncbi:hypothetical protein HU200_066652 [Digitaria exilis]|uniref:BHLH domain-containing protein n=1 Tax=Digitaria exilis TaxID=1010633 RepID=A0A835DTP6_9POAL|nr:hypothetical protein HU200_066652 [Digitaria exilis]
MRGPPPPRIDLTCRKTNEPSSPARSIEQQGTTTTTLLKQLARSSVDHLSNMSHIAVERNRRRQMNENLKVLRSLTPALYIKRGDQASIIGGAIDFIRELQQVLESLEARKKRRSSTGSIGHGCFSPSPTPSPRSHLVFSASGGSSSSSAGSSITPSPPVANNNKASSSALLAVKELAACCNSPVADVEARISGANVLLRTLSRRAPGQAARVVAVLEALHLEVLHLNISTMEDTVLHSFLSVEDLAYEVQQIFVCCFHEQEQQQEQEQEQPDQLLLQENLMYSAMAI